MQLDDLFILISVCFICMAIFFMIKAPRFADKLEAILFCILGFLNYGFLSAMYDIGEPKLPAIFLMAFLIFLWAMVFFIFREPRLMNKKQVILICLFGVVAYGSLFGVTHIAFKESIKGEITQDEFKTSKASK
ncbi:hypothetical protein [Clostridium tagluense]|uniref:hypothetical protein n=1 Tax=Clostridium tagluense TaxID=360422 RepID=UPI001CF442C9|nr:hypothetical protein [Clostridium tagluense]MCB2300384.1 hypothetical protein [Clostridium tagluense]